MTPRIALAAALGLTAAACSSAGSGDEGGSTFRNLLLYGGPTVPPAAPRPPLEAMDCPPVTVGEGGAALRVGGTADGTAPRLQISIANVARECIERPDGAVVVKVGVEARALLGPGGSAGRFEAPLSVVLRRGDRVLDSHSRRIAVVVPAGQTGGSVSVVEEGLVVPPGTGEFEIEVSLAAGGRAPRAARAARRR